MSLNVGELHAKLGLKTGEFDEGVDRSGRKWDKLGSNLIASGKAAAAGAGAALAGMAIKGVKDFAQLEKGMNEVFTLMPDISDAAMKKMTAQVRSFSKEMGVLPEETVPALYQAISAGVPRQNVFDFLEAAQKAAIGGVTDLTTAVDGISSVVNSYGADVVSATRASDLMFTAVKLGKTNFEQLSASLFNVLPTASALGVRFEDITAAMAAMTVQGTPTSVATTQMRQLLVELSKAGTATSETFHALAGKSFREFIAGGGDVQTALQLMAAEAAKSGGSISDMFGSVEAGAAALALTSESGEKAFGSALGEMRRSAGATDAAYARMDQGLARTWERIKVKASDALLTFGEKLAPAVEDLSDAAVDLAPLMGAVAGFLGDIAAEASKVLRPISAVVSWFGKTAESGGAMGEVLEGAKDAILNTLFPWRSFTSETGQAGDQAEDTADSVDSLAAAMSASAAAATAFSPELARFTAATEDLTAATDLQADATSGAEEALQSYTDRLRAMSDPIFAAITASRQAATAQQAYNEELARHGPDSAEALTAAEALLGANLDLAAAQDKLIELGPGFRGEFRQMAEAMGLPADQIDYIIGQLEILKTIKIDDKTFNVNARGNFGMGSGGMGFSVPGRAHGGSVAAGRLYRVGERNRPELYMIPGDRGQVLSNDQVRRLLSGGRSEFDLGAAPARFEAMVEAMGRQVNRSLIRTMISGTADAMRAASGLADMTAPNTERLASALAGSGQPVSFGDINVSSQADAREIADEIMWRQKTAGI